MEFISCPNIFFPQKGEIKNKHGGPDCSGMSQVEDLNTGWWRLLGSNLDGDGNLMISGMKYESLSTLND